MSTHQEHFGRKFTKDKKSGYWLSTDYPRIRAHRWVWEYNFGAIPPGYHIHHKDENKSNNDISNLKLVDPSEHVLLHMTPEKSKASKALMNKIRPLTKKWHQSEEGKAWHKWHAYATGFNQRKTIEYTCQQCNKPYISKTAGQTRFCSNRCRSKWRRLHKLDDIDKICSQCSIIFRSNKYLKVKCCSPSCAAKERWSKRQN